jgi:hypothetical protein
VMAAKEMAKPAAAGGGHADEADLKLMRMIGELIRDGLHPNPEDGKKAQSEAWERIRARKEG